MTGWGLIWAAIAFLLIANGVRLRRRSSALHVLAAAADHRGDGTSERAGDPGTSYRFICAAGVHLDPATRAAAIAYAAREHLRVLDLVPRNLDYIEAMRLLRMVDPRSFRKSRFAPGVGAFQALCVEAATLERARIEPREDLTPAEMLQTTKALKHYASDTMDLTVVPRLAAAHLGPAQRLALLRAVAGDVAMDIGLIFVLGEWAVIAGGLAVSLLWGAVALGAFSLQPLIVFAAGPMRPRRLSLTPVLRLPDELWHWLLTNAARRRHERPPDPGEQLRPLYDALLANGTDRFFDPRRSSCPLCAGDDLEVRLRSLDLLQHKPGRSTLERCNTCGHIFQNPRLSLEGLDFYYRDFYDGLYGDKADFVFGTSGRSYSGRATMPEGIFVPKRWLDVGAGHGHFCAAARDTWPVTAFDGLDMSETIEEAGRRGWVDTAYRGMFPDVAPGIESTYDVVSMHHYLEHTRDPIAELDAALVALQPGGRLLIELPDPSSVLGRLLGKYWLPWFQPQHQHFLSITNLTKLLSERGFAIEKVQRREAHQAVDFLGAAWLLMERLGPPGRLPWRPRQGLLGHVRWGVVRVPFIILLPLALAADSIVAACVRHAAIAEAHASNTYRILARAPGDRA